MIQDLLPKILIQPNMTSLIQDLLPKIRRVQSISCWCTSPYWRPPSPTSPHQSGEQKCSTNNVKGTVSCDSYPSGPFIVCLSIFAFGFDSPEIKFRYLCQKFRSVIDTAEYLMIPRCWSCFFIATSGSFSRNYQI